MATEISKVTGRSRATESACLNELARLNIVAKKTAKGRKHSPNKIFALKEEFDGEGKSVDG